MVEKTEPDWLGKKLNGRYEITQRLGNSGIAVSYYLATDRKFEDKQCGVKIYNKYACGFCDFRPVLLQEVHMMMKFAHPAILKIFDVIEDCEHFIIVRECVNARSLFQLIKQNGVFRESEAISIGLRLADVLNYLHTFNPPYICRSLKPDSVWITDSGEIKLGEVEISVLHSDGDADERIGSAFGMRGYAPPESFSGYVDPRSNIYSLGMTMYSLVTGTSPNDPPYVAQPIRRLNPAVSAGLEYIIQKCIQWDPNDRYGSCLELMDDMNNVQNLPPKKGIFQTLFGKRNKKTE